MQNNIYIVKHFFGNIKVINLHSIATLSFINAFIQSDVLPLQIEKMWTRLINYLIFR